MSVRAGLALVLLAAGAAAQEAPSAGAPDPSIRTALVTFADGNTLPLRNWTLSYDYVSWARGRSPGSGLQSGRDASHLWLGKRAVPMEDAVLHFHEYLRRHLQRPA